MPLNLIDYFKLNSEHVWENIYMDETFITFFPLQIFRI